MIIGILLIPSYFSAISKFLYSSITFILASLEQTSDIVNGILIVDDEFDITTVLRQGLEKQGFLVFGFTDPLLALEHFQTNSDHYGLVISDLRMPAMNGYEFIKKVKKIKPEVIVFLMTAFEIDDKEFRRLLQSVKIDEFIQKPIAIKNLVELVHRCVNVQISI
jgi:DNA-binding NtrC family response regulator